jgi:uncharacterized membrane protein
MSNRTTIFIILGLVIIMVGIGVYSYPRMPELVAIHWNAQGIPNGFGSRFEGAFLTPLITIGVVALLLVVPAIDPLKANIAKFRKDYNSFLVALLAFLTYLQVLTVGLNLGYPWNLTQFLIPGFGIFIYATGVLLGKAKRNYFIGIRTPWTLSSDSVWNKTHKLGGLLFKISGVISLLGIVAPGLVFLFLIVPLIAASTITIIYSYFVFRREEINQ